MKTIIALALFAVLGAGCSSVGKLIKEPKVKFHNLSVENPDAKGATLVVGLQVENPNHVELKVDEVVYELSISGKAISSGTLGEGAQIGAKETKIINVPIAVKYNDIFDSVLQLLSSKKTPYHVKGSAKMGLFNLPFDEKGELVFEKGRLK